MRVADDVIVHASRMPGEDPLTLERFRVFHPVVGGATRRSEDAYGYWHEMARHWGGKSTLVNVEHDMQVSDDLVAELVDCPHPLCAHAYLLYFPTTHEHEPHYAHSVSLAGYRPPIADIGHYTARGVRWVDAGEEWADFSGIGFFKVAPEARCGDLARATWQWLEMSVNGAVDCRWHLHWQAGASGPTGVEHHHQ